MPRQFFNLDDIFEDDADGLLDTPVPERAPGKADRLVQGFEEINAFVDRAGHAPWDDATVNEALLARRLTAILEDPERRAALAAYDRHALLQGPAFEAPATAADSDGGVDSSEEVTSLDDILADDDGLLDDDNSELFEARHVSFDRNKALPDEIAQRTPCEEFWRFEPLFHEMREELKSGQSHTERFKKASYVNEGDFFVLDGVLALVDHIGENDEGAGDHHNPRIRVVFDNGTESNMLLLSFTRALYKDRQGRRVMTDPDRALDGMRGVTHHDRRQGTIYILRSLSAHPEIKRLPNLYKIGYTEEGLSSRISGAEKSPTYLEAPVQVVATYDCYNANPYAIERLIHAMLAGQRLNVTLKDAEGNRYRPREWFQIPLETATAVVERIADGTISQYRIDATTSRLVRKSRRYGE